MPRPATKKNLRDSVNVHWRRTTEEDKKRRIIAAVLRLVPRYGVVGTTTARIAATAGMSEPTLYRTYRSKKEILLAAADAAWQVKQDSLAPAYNPDAITHLRNLLQSHTKQIQTSKIVLILFHFASAPARSGLPERIRQQNLVEVRRLAAIIQEAQAQKSIRPDVDPEEIAWRLHAANWSEALARLLHFEAEVLASGVSAAAYESILKEIVVEP